MHPQHPASIPRPTFDYAERPFLVIWETTHACELACVHCRASADPKPAPNELSYEEALWLIDGVKDMGTPVIVFSGGDAFKRPDLADLVRHAKKLGLRAGAIPAVTPLVTPERLREMKAAGLDQVAFSLDAANAPDHDAVRRVEGVFNRTLQAIEWAKDAGLPVQINSLVNVHNLEKLDELLSLIEKLGVVFWEVFFLVPTGRGSEVPMLTAEKFEEAFAKIYELNKRVSFIIKITEAQHYRRFCIEQEIIKSGKDPKKVREFELELPSYMKRLSGPHGSIGMAPQGVNAGKGFIFVNKEGEVYPSSFLPFSAGNVRQKPLKEIYRDSPFLIALRDTKNLKGRCGLCSYRDICGGSRSRAYAMTGDCFAEDPCCAFQPQPAAV